MTGFSYKQGILHADDVALPALAEKYGSPVYVYSASKIRDTVQRLQSALAKALPASAQPLICFACKANSNIAVMGLMNSLGLGADIVSGGEFARARAGNIPANKIVFSGVGKSHEEIRNALKAGILQINVESRPELERIAKIAAEMNVRAPIALRINPDVDAGTHAKITTGKSENKFGMPGDEALELYEWATKQPSLHPRGFSMHIGSQLTSIDPYREAFTVAASFAQKVRARGLPLEVLDLGGGLGVVYEDGTTPPDLDDYARAICDIIHPLGTQIIIEPGRLLVAEAGLLLSRVMYVKHGEKRKYLILDAGMNDLMRPALYEAYHPILPVERDESRPTSLYDVVGPVCETGDTFAVNRPVPEMREGELAALMVGGAYGFVMTSQYNTRPLLPEILVDGSKAAQIRRRETLDDILGKETIPDWVK